jgi:isocitrate lyase
MTVEVKKVLYSLGVFDPNSAKQRIIRRFAIIFVIGGLITVIKNYITGNPMLDDTSITLFTSLVAMLEKAIRENKAIEEIK